MKGGGPAEPAFGSYPCGNGALREPNLRGPDRGEAEGGEKHGPLRRGPRTAPRGDTRAAGAGSGLTRVATVHRKSKSAKRRECRSSSLVPTVGMEIRLPRRLKRPKPESPPRTRSSTGRLTAPECGDSSEGGLLSPYTEGVSVANGT